jgi:hypothetical protein
VISAICVGRSSPFVEDYDMVEPVTSHTGFNGYFSVNCPIPAGEGVWDYIDGTAFLRDSDVNVTGQSGAPAGASFSGTHGSHHEIRAANDFAANAYTNLHQHVQSLFSKFGRSRSRVDFQVHPTDMTFGPEYRPGSDVVWTNYTRVFDANVLHDGMFRVLHEYAHAFHWIAVEPPGAYSCTDNEHDYTEYDNLSCAVVEGIADFIAFWTIGSITYQSPYGGDYGLENNHAGGPTPTNQVGADGVRMEAAVASFLYDLVDGSNELDTHLNTAGPSETHDDLTVPASWVLDVIQQCRLSGFVSAIGGADHLAYCLEKSVSAWSVASALSPTWRQVTSVTFDQPVATYDAAKIRTLWRYNLFGVYP